jgi:hypothetical protein
MKTLLLGFQSVDLIHLLIWRHSDQIIFVEDKLEVDFIMNMKLNPSFNYKN